MAPAIDATAAGTTIVSDDSDNTSSFSSDAAPSIDATAAGTTIISDNSDNTASVSSDAAPSAHATAAVSDDSDDNIASVSSKVAPSADATAAGTTIASDDSDNTVSFGGDDARTAGSRGLSDPAAAITSDTPIPTDDSDNAIPTGGDSAIAAESRGFSDPAAVITTSTPIPTDDSDNAIPAGGNTATAPVAVITTSTPIPTDDSDNAISASGDAAIAEGSRRFSDPAASTTADAPSLSTDQSVETVQLFPSQQTLPRLLTRPTLQSMLSLLQLLPLHLILLTILPMSAVRTLSSAHCVVPESAYSSTQFKVEQTNSLKSVVTGLKNDFRDVRQENFDMKATLERNIRKIKALEDRLSKCLVSPIVNSQTGMQCHTTSGRSPNAQNLDGQTQTGLLPMPQTPPNDKSTTSLLSTTTATTTNSSTLNSEQSMQLSTNKTAADSSADSTILDIRVNRSRQVPPSLRLPKEGSLAALLIGDSNLRHVDRRRLDQNGKIHVRTVGGATAGDFSASLTNQSPREDTSHVIVHTGTNDCSDTITITSSWSLSASWR